MSSSALAPWFKTLGRFSWFPGHMAKATKEIKSSLKAVDMILEVRDARIPISSGNPLLSELMGHKRKMIILNKADLADPALIKRSVDHLRSEAEMAVPLIAHNPRSVKEVLKTLEEWVGTKGMHLDTILLMVAGVPNCGKSSLINGLHKLTQVATGKRANPSKTGPNPGVTRHLSSFKILSSPRSVYVMDTPGVMAPRVQDLETGLRLAIAGSVKDSVVGPEMLAQYLLAMLHTQPHHRETLRVCAGMERRSATAPHPGTRSRYRTPASTVLRMLPPEGTCIPAEDYQRVFGDVLLEIGSGFGKAQGGEEEDLRLRASIAMLQWYRKGALGLYTWDDV